MVFILHSIKIPSKIPSKKGHGPLVFKKIIEKREKKVKEKRKERDGP
jgi:hypothetical protein